MLSLNCCLNCQPKVEISNHGSYRHETFLFKYFSRTFQGQITFFQGLAFYSIWLFCLYFSFSECDFSVLSFSRRQECGHNIDTKLFACPLSMHSSSLCIEGHVPISYFISTGPSALLTPWHRKRWLTRDVTTSIRNCSGVRVIAIPYPRKARFLRYVK